MKEQILRQILEKIKAYPRILLFRHIRVDGDCVGASRGLQGILRASFPEKEVLLYDGQTSEQLSFLGPDDPPYPDEACRDALAIVVDVSDRDRISNPQYALCREIIKIDHHIEVDVYGRINWVEPERSSACEMIAEFYWAFRQELKLPLQAATDLFMGMVTDSGRFRFSSVSGDTLRLAGMLLDRGVDTERLYAQLYLTDLDALKLRAHVYENLRCTENGVAWVYVDGEMQRQFGLSLEASSAVISYLENIKGCLCWLAFIQCPDPKDGIRVRLRSRFMAINAVAERHHGGGHACASGATVYSREEMDALIQEADQAVKRYKAENEGWM